MMAVALLSLVVPCTVGIVYFALRPQLARLETDARGIALQTVIIMVVLLAVAGGVAAVLLSRGGEAVSDIERQDISRQASDFSGAALCQAAGFVWSGSPAACHES